MKLDLKKCKQLVRVSAPITEVDPKKPVNVGMLVLHVDVAAFASERPRALKSQTFKL